MKIKLKKNRDFIYIGRGIKFNIPLNVCRISLNDIERIFICIDYTIIDISFFDWIAYKIYSLFRRNK